LCKIEYSLAADVSEQVNNNSANKSPKDSGKKQFIGPFSESKGVKNEEIEMKEIKNVSFQEEPNIMVNKQDSSPSNMIKSLSIKSQASDIDFDDNDIKEINNIINEKNFFDDIINGIELYTLVKNYFNDIDDSRTRNLDLLESENQKPILKNENEKKNKKEKNDEEEYLYNRNIILKKFVGILLMIIF
jgi:hypothetical protein